MRGHAEGIGYGDAVPSESLLQIFREEQAAPALGGGGEDHAVPETETVRGSEFGSTHDPPIAGVMQAMLTKQGKYPDGLTSLSQLDCLQFSVLSFEMQAFLLPFSLFHFPFIRSSLCLPRTPC
jgi:hypothetical protein